MEVQKQAKGIHPSASTRDISSSLPLLLKSSREENLFLLSQFLKVEACERLIALPRN